VPLVGSGLGRGVTSPWGLSTPRGRAAGTAANLVLRTEKFFGKIGVSASWNFFCFLKHENFVALVDIGCLICGSTTETCLPHIISSSFFQLGASIRTRSVITASDPAYHAYDRDTFCLRSRPDFRHGKGKYDASVAEDDRGPIASSNAKPEPASRRELMWWMLRMLKRRSSVESTNSTYRRWIPEEDTKAEGDKARGATPNSGAARHSGCGRAHT
jgi:hypothetical protein